MPIRFGIDQLSSDLSLLRGARRIGLLTNDAARLASDSAIHSRSALRALGVPVSVLFSPEHGIRCAAPDGAAVSGEPQDALTGWPVVSLYGESFAPAQSLLRTLDLVVVDLPDVGSRFYTYAWTMTHVLDACASAGVPVLVLDRPNPLGGRIEDVEGPMLDPDCESFLGRCDIPVRHSLTIGELARLWQRERAPHVILDVVPCRGWSREMSWPDTSLPFVPMSPAMRSFETALLYPGLCLFEATNLSIDRFGPRPFAVIEAPWLDAAGVLDALALDGAPVGVRLAAGPHRIAITIVDAKRVRPVALGLALLACIARSHDSDFAWSDYPTAANPTGARHLERLTGTSVVRGVIDRRGQVDSRWLEAHGWRARLEAVAIYA